ncbi:MAG: glycosyltransferase [Pedobacter sp.]|nr:MAG: glycosyltransferase [Pedobacter sp.]
MTDKISVIMPAYNASKYIEASINCVISQVYKNWELIVVDDGSTDDTFTIIERYTHIDDRIKVIRQENKKQGEAKNQAIKNCTGKYLAFLDADDLWMPNKLSISLRELKKGNYDLLFTDAYFFENEFIELKQYQTFGITEHIYHGKEGILMFLENNRIPNLTVLVKTDIITFAGPFRNIHAAEDYDMWLRLLSHGARFKAIGETLSMYRMHNESVSAKDRNAIYETISVLKCFGAQNNEFKEIVRKISKDKFRYWLYNDPHLTKKKIRALLSVFSFNIYKIPITFLSYLLPISIFRKIINRIIL